MPPRFFNGGVNNVAIGNPGQIFLNAVDSVTKDQNNRRIAQIAQDRLDFVTSAPARAEAKRIADLKRASENGIFANQTANELFQPDFTRLDAVHKILNSTPGFEALGPNSAANKVADVNAFFQHGTGRPADPAVTNKIFSDVNAKRDKQVAAEKKFINENISLSLHATDYANSLTTALLNSKRYTPEQVKAIVTDEVNKRYPTISNEQATAQNISFDNLFKTGKSGNNVSIFNGGTASTGTNGSGSFSFVSQPTPVSQQQRVTSEVFDNLGIKKQNLFRIFGLAPANILSTVGIKGFEVTKQNAQKAITKITNRLNIREDVAVKMIQGELSSDHETNFNPDELSNSQIDALGKRYENLINQSNQLLNRKSGNFATGGQVPAGSVNNFGSVGFQNLFKFIQQHNQEVNSQTVPSAFSDQQLANVLGPIFAGRERAVAQPRQPVTQDTGTGTDTSTSTGTGTPPHINTKPQGIDNLISANSNDTAGVNTTDAILYPTNTTPYADSVLDPEGRILAGQINPDYIPQDGPFAPTKEKRPTTLGLTIPKENSFRSLADRPANRPKVTPSDSIISNNQNIAQNGPSRKLLPNGDIELSNLPGHKGKLILKPKGGGWYSVKGNSLMFEYRLDKNGKLIGQRPKIL